MKKELTAKQKDTLVSKITIPTKLAKNIRPHKKKQSSSVDNDETSGKKQRYQFPKGVSGNPAGRPKGVFTMKSYLERELAKILEVTGVDGKAQKQLVAELVARKLAMIAIKGEGDLPAIREIFDRIDGKPTQEVNMNADISTNQLSQEELDEVIRVQALLMAVT